MVFFYSAVFYILFITINITQAAPATINPQQNTVSQQYGNTYLPGTQNYSAGVQYTTPQKSENPASEVKNYIDNYGNKNFQGTQNYTGAFEYGAPQKAAGPSSEVKSYIDNFSLNSSVTGNSKGGPISVETFSTDPMIIMIALRDAVKNNDGQKFTILIRDAKPKKLDLSSLGLTSLPGWFNQVALTSIESLDLSNNQLSNLKGLENMSNLQTLIVTRNKLTSLEGIQNLSKIVTLYASYNLLGQYKASNPNQSLPLSNLPVNVQDLVLDANGFSGSLPNFSSLNSLIRIAVNGNPGLTRVCGSNQSNPLWPFSPLINAEKLMQFEIMGAANLDPVSKICLRRISEKRTAQSAPIKILMN